MILAFDANILAYAEGVNDRERQSAALDVIAALPSGSVVAPVQVFGELFAVLTRKLKWPPAQARLAVLAWRDVLQSLPTTESSLLAAMDLVTDHGLQIWDAVILAAAAEARCRILLTEDLQDGFVWRGVTIINPFASPRHPLLVQILEP